MGFGIHQPYGNKRKIVYSLTQREVGRKHSIWGCNPLFRTAIVCATSGDDLMGDRQSERGGVMTSAHEVTLLLAEWAKGNQEALNELTPLVYREVRQLA